LRIDTKILLVALPSAVIFSTNLAAHSVSFVSTNGQFLQSSSSFHCSPDHFAILRSILYEDTFDQPAVVAVPALQELLLAEQLVVAACLQPGQQVQQHIAVVAAAAAAAAHHIVCRRGCRKRRDFQ